MNIILVSSRMARAITLGPRQLALIVSLIVLLTSGMAFILGALYAPSPSNVPLLRMMPGAATRQSEIDALAVKLGELQAKLMRLDGFAKQIGSKTGIDATRFLSDQPAPRGGIAATGAPFSAGALQQQIQAAEAQLTAYQDQFTLAEATLMLPGPGNLPVLRPVAATLMQSSSFGARIDPLTGRQAFHEGIDFLGDAGSPIKAAGNGIVTFAAYHPEYGNMIDIDHGNGLISRYAHNSKLNVREGDKIIAGQVISLLGNSGRSTGAHLHFEIRYKNVPQNPLRFLAPDIVASKTSAEK